MDTLFSISPPEHFDFSDFGSWPNWIRRYERFRVAAGIGERSQEYQVNSLIYTMGDKADDILSTLALSEEDRKKYDRVKEAFERHFVSTTLFMKELNSTRGAKNRESQLKHSLLQFIN